MRETRGCEGVSVFGGLFFLRFLCFVLCLQRLGKKEKGWVWAGAGKGEWAGLMIKLMG